MMGGRWKLVLYLFDMVMDVVAHQSRHLTT